MGRTIAPAQNFDLLRTDGRGGWTNTTSWEQGFTSGEANGTLGANFELGEVLLANGSAWLAGWEEGTFVEGKVRLRSARSMKDRIRLFTANAQCASHGRCPAARTISCVGAAGRVDVCPLADGIARAWERKG